MHMISVCTHAQLAALRGRLTALMGFYGVSVQRLAMLLGENPVSDNPRYLHQRTTIAHGRLSLRPCARPRFKGLRVQGLGLERESRVACPCVLAPAPRAPITPCTLPPCPWSNGKKLNPLDL